jgi:hypothetical protein
MERGGVVLRVEVVVALGIRVSGSIVANGKTLYGRMSNIPTKPDAQGDLGVSSGVE